MGERRWGRGSQQDYGEIVFGAPWAYDEGFRIDTVMPSAAVLRAVERGLIPRESRVVDLGCGKNPRNALYFAGRRQCYVDGVDLEPVEIPKGAPDTIRHRMNFHQMSVMDFALDPETYHTALLARLIQYLSPEDMRLLIGRVHSSLSPGGVMLVSYTAEGGIHNRASQYGIETFFHPIEDFKTLLTDTGFQIASFEDGVAFSTSVPHQEQAVTYDLVVQK